MSKEQIAKALDELRQRGFWDEELVYASDEALPLSPLGQFIITLHELDPEALCWLTFFAAQRAISSYYQSINNWFPSLAQIKQQLLREKTNINWAEAIKTSPAPNDCSVYLYSALENCAKYIHFKKLEFAIDCIVDADDALAYGGRETDFRTWLTEVAIPAALQKRELTEQ